MIEQLSIQYPHSITLVQEAISGKPETGNFTCFQYAFALIDLPDRIRRIANRFPDIFVSSGFAGWLADDILEPIELRAAHRGDLVLYRMDTEVRHAARLSGKLAVSKWGLGHLWRHGLLEVPASFGSDLQYFRSIPGSLAGSAFVKFAKQKLGSETVEHLIGR